MGVYTGLITAVPEGAESGLILVEVAGKKTQSPSFMVISSIGNLKISSSTTGEDLGSDGYSLTLESSADWISRIRPSSRIDEFSFVDGYLIA